MHYLGYEYRLSSVNGDVYKAQTRIAEELKGVHSLENTLRELTAEEDPTLAQHILSSGIIIESVYGEGGGYFSLSFGVGIAALREVNPIGVVPRIDVDVDWDLMVARQAELQQRPGITTLEEQAGIGLLEVSSVNDGYIEGYRTVYDSSRLLPFLGFTGIGALNAHDLMHFASVRA